MAPGGWVAAMLTREPGVPVNRKRVQRIFRKLGYSTPSRTKREIIRSKEKPVRAERPNEVWEVDMTYIWCGIDGWGYLFNVFDVYTPENGSRTASTCRQSRKTP